MPKRNRTVYLIDGLRTAIGVPYKGLKNFTVAQLSAFVISDLLRRNPAKKKNVDEVILGNTVSAGTGQNFARQAVVLARLPIETSAFCVNHVCGSGLQSIILAGQAICAGSAGLVVAGGAESATRTPNLISKDDAVPLKDRTPIDSLIYDGLWDILSGCHMGELCEEMVKEKGISREEQDAYALASHQKAVAAIDAGKFRPEIVDVPVSSSRIFNSDERPRRKVKLENFTSLRPAFSLDGSVTAGNASAPSDGACAALLASEEAVRSEKLLPRARILGCASIAVEPREVFAAGIIAVRQCLRDAQLAMGDIDLFEISEAFAAQAIVIQRGLKIPEEKMNVWGGDLALGHPLGSAGARILVTLMHALEDQEQRRGVCCVCLGGGGAVAVAIERVTG